MGMHGVLREYLNRRPKPRNAYAYNLRPFDAPPETRLLDVERDVFGDHLDACGLTQRQKVGVRHVFNKSAVVRLRDETGKATDRYDVTVGDIQALRDEDLLRLTGESSAKVLRRLFGRVGEPGDIGIDEQSLPPFLERRFKSR